MRRAIFGRNLVFFAFSALVTVACKGVGPHPDISGGDSPGPAAPGANGSFLGQWTGKYVAKDQSTSLHETPAHATFTGNDIKSGTFLIQLTQVTDAFVSGSFTLIDQTSLMLDISKSTISSIGLAGSQSLLTYRLLGNTLELSNDLVRLVFAPDAKHKDDSRDSVPAPSQPSNPDPNTDNGLPTDGTIKEQFTGSWTCSDRASNQWRLNIRADDAFAIEISNSQSGRGAIWLAGPITYAQDDANPHATLRVTSSAVAKYNGMQLKASLRGQSELILLRVGNGEEISCTKS